MDMQHGYADDDALLLVTKNGAREKKNKARIIILLDETLSLTFRWLVILWSFVSLFS